jgi:hypothetical protein
MIVEVTLLDGSTLPLDLPKSATGTSQLHVERFDISKDALTKCP